MIYLTKQLHYFVQVVKVDCQILKKTIQSLEPSAPMVKGLYVSKSASKEATSDVKEWVNEIK